MVQLFLSSVSANQVNELHFIERGDRNNSSILFIHGTPGSAKGFQTYYEDENLQKTYHMVSVDRLGFGESSKKSEDSLSIHAESIIGLMESKWPEKKFTCLGHSYGVPVCLEMFSLRPELFNAGVMLAGAVNPNRKILRWYNYWANTWFIKLFLSRGFENSNDEMKGLREELYKLEKKLSQIEKKILIIHGQKDKIVPFEDSQYLKDQLVKAELKVLTPEKMGHMFLWNQRDYVKSELVTFVESLQSK